MNKWSQDDASSAHLEATERSKVPQFPDIAKQDDSNTFLSRVNRDSIEEESLSAAEIIKQLNIKQPEESAEAQQPAKPEPLNMIEISELLK